MLKKIVVIIVLISPLILTLACSNSKNEKKDINNEETNNKIEFYQKRIAVDPIAYAYYNRLAQAYILKARETGDTVYYDKAEETLKKSLELNSKNYVGTLYLAMVNISKHDFKEALKYAEKAIILNPDESYAYGVFGDAYNDLGETDKALGTYEKMLRLKPNLDSYSRISNLRVIKGDTDGAIRAMQKAYEAGLKDVRTPKENLAWTQVMLGSQYFNMGDLEEAKKHYNKSLEIMPNYYLALEHLAEVNAAEGKYEEAQKLYKSVLEINPSPEFYIALAGAYESKGRENEAERLYKKAQDIYESYVDNGDVGYLRNLALFYADNSINLEKALDMAKRDLQMRKDVYAYDTLGWIYYKQGKFDKALGAYNESLKLSTKDAKLYYHAGMINYKLNNIDKANEYLTLALSTNPYFDTASAKEAKNTLEKIASKNHAKN